MFIADIHLAHPKLVLVPTLTAVPEMAVELENQVIADSETYFLFFTVSGGDFTAFDAAVEDDETVSESRVIIDGEDFRVYRMRLEALEYLVLPRAAELGMHVLHAVGAEGGWRATLQIPAWNVFHEFRSFCTGQGVDVAVRRLYEPGEKRGGKFGLTAAQRDILSVAYQHGYFKEPREASLSDVAGQLDISSSAASGRLRRALETLLGETVVRDDSAVSRANRG